MKQHIEEIECPECGKREIATVKHTVPHYTYIHECACGYTIMESEWILINSQCELDIIKYLEDIND